MRVTRGLVPAACVALKLLRPRKLPRSVGAVEPTSPRKQGVPSIHIPAVRYWDISCGQRGRYPCAYNPHPNSLRCSKGIVILAVVTQRAQFKEGMVWF